MTVRVGVVGAGAFGAEHADAYARLAGVRLVSIEDVDARRAAAVAERLGVGGGEAPEAVSVVVPVAARGNLVRDLVSAGRAVLIEKPLAATGREARELVALTERRPVMVGHVLRFAEPYVRLERAARALGPLRGGRLLRVRSAAHETRHPGDDVVGLTMIHDLDAAAWLAGSAVATVSATGARGGSARWVSGEAELTMADGTHWLVAARWEGEDAQQRDEASVTAADGRTESLAVTADDDAYALALDAELAHFVECARDGVPSQRLVMADAARAVAVADAVRASLEQTGATVDVD